MIKYIKLFVLLISFSVFAQRTDLSGLKFCIDPGHGGNNPANDRLVIPDPGVNFWESESNFQKALLIKPMIEARNGWVILTRYTNYYPDDTQEPSLTARWTLANQNNVHWFHSIHSNATGGTNNGTNYTMVLIKENKTTRQPQFPEAVTMSSYIYNHIRTKIRTSASGGNIQPGVYLDYTFYGGPNGGYNLGVLSGLVMPGQLSEGSFHDFYPETRRLMNNDYRKMEAWAIYNGFLQYYQAPYDSIGFISGIIKNSETNVLLTGAPVKLMPNNVTYTTDNYKNGYYMFEQLKPGSKKVLVEIPGYEKDSTTINVALFGTYFADRNLIPIAAPKVQFSSPKNGDTTYPVNSQMGIIFTREMDTTSLRAAFHFLPNVQYTLSFTNQNKSAIFYVTKVLDYNTNYTIIVDSTAKGINGIFIDGNGDGNPGDPYIVNFRTQQNPVSVNENSINPISYKLAQNYPNPFNSSTIINFTLPKEEFVTLKIYNILGKEISTLVNKRLSAGIHNIRFNSDDLPSGIYFYKIIAGSFTETRKLVINK